MFGAVSDPLVLGFPACEDVLGALILVFCTLFVASLLVWVFLWAGLCSAWVAVFAFCMVGAVLRRLV